MSSQNSKLPKAFASIIQPSFPYTAPNDGFCTMRFAIGAQGAYHLYITISGVLFHPFCGYGNGTGWQDSRTFAFRKGDVLAISDSSNTGNIVADIILFK